MRATTDPLLAGNVWLAPGDVFLFAGGKKHIVDYVNSSRARAVPMESSVTTVTTRFGQKIEFSKSAKSIDISPQVEAGFVIERLGASGLKEFLKKKHNRKEIIMQLELGDVIQYSLEESPAGKTGRFTTTAVSAKSARIASMDYEPGKLTVVVIPRAINDFFLVHKPRLTAHERKNEHNNFLTVNASAVEELTAEPTGEETKQMPKKASAKSAKAPKSKKAGEPSRGALGQVMGFSASSVIRRLGKEGLDAGQIDRALKSQGVTADVKTIRVSIRKVVLDDKTKKFAELSAEQLAKLVKAAGDATV